MKQEINKHAIHEIYNKHYTIPDHYVVNERVIKFDKALTHLAFFLGGMATAFIICIFLLELNSR